MRWRKLCAGSSSSCSSVTFSDPAAATAKPFRTRWHIVASETATSITLRHPGGSEEVVLRSQIRSLRSTALSLMPEGLEAAITPQQMSDLLLYLQQLRD